VRGRVWSKIKKSIVFLVQSGDGTKVPNQNQRKFVRRVDLVRGVECVVAVVVVVVIVVVFRFIDFLSFFVFILFLFLFL